MSLTIHFRCPVCKNDRSELAPEFSHLNFDDEWRVACGACQTALRFHLGLIVSRDDPMHDKFEVDYWTRPENLDVRKKICSGVA